MYFEFQPEQHQAWVPTVDVCERANEIVLIVELPGVERSDVKLSWYEGILTISGQKRQQSEVAVGRYHRVERSYGYFQRDIAINVPIEHDTARAELRDGLMRIYLPKRGSRQEPSNIPIG